MAIKVLIIGKSGSGKSCSLRNCDPQKTSIIKALNKPLPFKATFEKSVVTDDYSKIQSLLQKTSSDLIVLDDAGYLQTNSFMRGHSGYKGSSKIFDFYNELADMFWQMLNNIDNLPNNKIVYVIMHEETDEAGNIKPKTLGKLTDKYCVEGLFSIVLHSMYMNGEYVFSTQTNGADVSKSPIGMFEQHYIPNDLKEVDKTIRNYYGLN